MVESSFIKLGDNFFFIKTGFYTSVLILQLADAIGQRFCFFHVKEKYNVIFYIHALCTIHYY